VLRDVCLDVQSGESVGLVGESGSGKTTLALALLGLLDHTGANVRGRVCIAGQDLIGLDERRMRSIRGRVISLIPQSPTAALNPTLRIESHLREAWHAHSRDSWESQQARVGELLTSAGLPVDKDFLRRYPRQISVGQAQRILIVMALVHDPLLLIADEPTSSLDVITRAEVLELLARIRRLRNMAMLFISHDLTAAARLCSRVAVLHEGRIVESGRISDVLANPKHPYTRRLARAVSEQQTSSHSMSESGG
jgi:ABC-type glutathione transport system ATPase component